MFGWQNPKVRVLLLTLVILLASFVFLSGRQGVAREVQFGGQYAYVAMGEYGGVRIIDLTEVQNPIEVGHYDTLGQANGLALAGEYLLVADGDRGLGVLNIGDPRRPREVGRLLLPGVAEDVVFANGFVYLAAGEAGLRVIDIRDPGSPVEIGSLELEGRARRIAFEGGMVYLVAGEPGVYLISVLNPTAPMILGRIDTQNAQDVFAVGTTVYIADATEGLRIFDASLPNKPKQIGTFPRVPGTQGGSTPFEAPPSYQVTSLQILGPYALLGTEASGLLVVDVLNPTAPTLLGQLPVETRSEAIAVQGDLVALSLGREGVYWVRLLNFTQPVIQSITETPGEAGFVQLVMALWERASGERPALQPKVVRTLRNWLTELAVLLGLGLVFWTFIFSQFVLPVRKFRERMLAYRHLWYYLLGVHGPALCISNGRLIEREEESEKRGPGVILLDTASAAVLRRKAAFTRAVGPGVVFTQNGEYIAEPVDLQTQTQSLGPEGEQNPFLEGNEQLPDEALATRGTTRDGVETIPNIQVSFRLRCTPGKGHTQYGFEPDPVFRAVVGGSVEAHLSPDMHVGYRPWNKLPAYLAVDVWREYLQRFTLNELFDPNTGVIKGAAASERDLVSEDGLWGETGLEIISRLLRARLTQETVEELDEAGRFLGKKVLSREYELLRERGIRVISVRIHNLRFHPEMERKIVARWQSTWLDMALQMRDLIEHRRSYAVHQGKVAALMDLAEGVFIRLGRALKEDGSPGEDLLDVTFDFKQVRRELTKGQPDSPEIIRQRAATLELLIRETRRLCVKEPVIHRNLLNEEAELTSLIEWSRRLRL
jgi:hypothetical protein